MSFSKETIRIISEAKQGKKNPQFIHGLDKYRTFSWLYKQYIIEQKSLSQIASIVGVDIKTIFKWMDKVHIKRRNCGSRLGKYNHHWKKGRFINSQGYVLCYAPSHPSVNPAKPYIREHTLLIEQYLGRYLLSSETVHHINEIKTDNRLSNLYLFPNSGEHSRYHQMKRMSSDGFVPITESNLSMCR